MRLSGFFQFSNISIMNINRNAYLNVKKIWMANSNSYRKICLKKYHTKFWCIHSDPIWSKNWSNIHFTLLKTWTWIKTNNRVCHHTVDLTKYLGKAWTAWERNLGASRWGEDQTGDQTEFTTCDHDNSPSASLWRNNNKHLSINIVDMQCQYASNFNQRNRHPFTFENAPQILNDT